MRIGEYWRFDETGQYHGTWRTGVRLRFREDDIGRLAQTQTSFRAGGKGRSVKRLYIETVTNNYTTGLCRVLSGEEYLHEDFKEDLSLIGGGREFTFAGKGNPYNHALEFKEHPTPVYAWFSHHIWWHQ